MASRSDLEARLVEAESELVEVKAQLAEERTKREAVELELELAAKKSPAVALGDVVIPQSVRDDRTTYYPAKACLNGPVKKLLLEAGRGDLVISVALIPEPAIEAVA